VQTHRLRRAPSRGRWPVLPGARHGTGCYSGFGGTTILDTGWLELTDRFPLGVSWNWPTTFPISRPGDRAVVLTKPDEMRNGPPQSDQS
jgi:hypothetical protein